MPIVNVPLSDHGPIIEMWVHVSAPRDVLSDCLLVYNGLDRRVSLAFP